jgi:gliding motility-associated-like protein
MQIGLTLRKITNYLFWFLALFLVNLSSYAQTKKFNIQTSFPSSLTICGKSDSVVFEIRNISSGGITSLSLNLKLPSGVYYKTSSFKGSGVTELNISNLNSPVFKLNNFTLAGYLRFSVKLNSTCDLQSFISKGNPALIALDFTYSGGNETHSTSPVNVSTPNILMTTMVNQVKNAYLNDKFVRTTTIKNTGKGGAANVLFYRTNGAGLKVRSSRSTDKYNADSIVSKLDSIDFKLVGNKDSYFDENEEVIISDTVTVIRCNALTSLYTVKFGCGATVCNFSTKNALVNLDPFIQGLTIIPSSSIDWCFDKSKPSTNQLIVINKCNKPIQNTLVFVQQSYTGGFYNAEMSAIDTSTMVLRKGKHGKKLTTVYNGFEYNAGTGFYSCLGSNPIGGFTLNLETLAVLDTIYITWKSTACIPNACNNTLTAHRWTYYASFMDPCGSYYSLNEAWGSGGGIQYMSAVPWTPTDLVAGVPDKLNFTISSASFFPYTNRVKFAVKLALSGGIKQTLNTNDFKFTDVNGNDWKPYKVRIDSGNVWAFFTSPTINLLKSELNIVIEADCSSSNPSGIKNYALSILYDMDTACKNNNYFQLYCMSGQLKVHCTKNCKTGGMLFKSFTVSRKNFGKPDNNNDGIADATGSLNMARVKKNSSMVYDTLSTFYTGQVMANSSTNIFFNGRIKTKIANGSLLKPLTANLIIYRAGKLRYSCNKLPVNTYTSGTVRYCEIDLNVNSAKTAGCGSISNYFFLQSDSVIVNLNYVYTTSAGYYSVDAFFENTEFYLSTTPNPSSNQKLQCDTFSGRHILYGSFFTDWYTENYTSNSCAPVTLSHSFYYSAGNCCDNYAGGNPFPFEYRNFNYLDKIKVALPKGYIFSSAAIYYYHSSGTSKYTLQSATKIKPFKVFNDTLFFDMDTLFNATKGIFKRSDEGYQGTLSLNVLPTCKAAINFYEPIKYFYQFKWPSNGAVETVSNYPDYIKFDHPSVLINAINSVSVSKKDTFTWDIVVTNTNSGSSINSVWLANTLTQKANIIAIKDLATGTNLNVKNGIFKAGSLSSTAARTFRIYAISKNCKMDSIKIALGWNCDSYPDSLEVFSCKNLLNYLNLVLSPEPPLIISTLLEDTARTDVCTNRKYQAIVANVDEDNIYQLKLKVTIPPGTSFVDTGMYYSYPYGSANSKLSKPVLISGTTYEWALSDSLSVLKNGLERVSDSAKSKIKINFYLETNCQITAGAFVSIMPDGRIGCGEPVRRIGFTGSPIKIKGVDNPYYSLVTLSPDSINLCSPSVSFKAKIIFLGPTNTLANDSLLLSMPVGFIPDTASLKTIKINGKGLVKEVNQEMRWSWAIPKGLLPGDSSMLDFKLFINNKAPACGKEAFSLQAVTKKKAFCVKTNDSCDINVATGSFYKSLKLDRAAPNIKLIKSISVNAGDSGEILDLSFNVVNNNKSIDTALSTSFYLVVDKNGNGKFEKSELMIKKFTQTKGWASKQQVIFNFKGFVKNTNLCQLLIVSDSLNCQCLANSLPILNIQLKNAGRDTSFCSNYPVLIGLDSIKNYKYEWLPSDYLSSTFKSKTLYKKPNLASTDLLSRYILKTNRPNGCFSYDTVVIRARPYIFQPNLKDTIGVCFGNPVQLGDTVRGGKAPLTFNWSPSTGLSSVNKMIVNANPNSSGLYRIVVKDANNCSVKDSVYLKVSQIPSVKIGHIGRCEKNNVTFVDQSNYFGSKKGTVLWRINYNLLTQPSPVYIFDTTGLNLVKLVVSSEYGCTDSAAAYINIYGIPSVANSKTSPCIGDSVRLTDKSTISLMKIKNTSWKFDTDSLVGKSVAKLFPKAGTHYFTQYVTSDSGCTATYFDSLIVYDKPSVNFSKTGKCSKDTFNFINLSKVQPNDSIAKTEWIFTDTVASSKNMRYYFGNAGTNDVLLKVKSAKGCIDSLKKSITINPNPIPNFSVPNYCNYDTIKVTNLSNISKGSIKSYSWNLLGTINSSAVNPIFSPLSSGNYSIRLIVVSDSACTDSTFKSVIINPIILPHTSRLQVCENDSMTFSDISNQANTRISKRLWQLGTSSFSDSTFRIKAGVKGIFKYSLTVTTAEGCVYKHDSIYETFEKPIANFISNSPCNDNAIDFTDQSTPGSGASIVSRQWFDNGTLFNSGTNFRKLFAGTGTHSIKLKVTNSFGCTDTISQNSLISSRNFSDFKVNDACPDDTVNAVFTGFTGSNAITKYLLKWGDGQSSSTLPASHTYSSSGSYNLQLSISTLAGCDYDTIKKITIYPKPVAKFSYYPPYPDVKNPKVTITDNSFGAQKWQYYFGDNSGSSVLQNPIYSYKDSGEYFIKQLIENQYGCKDTATKRVFINFILFTHIPNAFSPGNDDINPLFQPSGLGIKDFKIIIYNRWGEKLFDPGWGRYAWDGKYLDEFVQIGMYPYYIEVMDFGNVRHSYYGVLNLIR